MANIEQLVCTWSGWPGAPGYSVFYGSQGGGAQATFNAFWTSLKPYLPSVVTITIPNTGKVFDEATGQTQPPWTSGTTTTVVGTAATSFSAVSGALIQWYTNVYDRGHRIKGRTFLVPIASSAYHTSGILGDAPKAAIAAAADTLWRQNGTSLKVWHRPVYTGTPPNRVLKYPGFAYPITSSNCASKVTYLRRRRDT